MGLLPMLSHAQRAPKSLKTSCGGAKKYEKIEKIKSLRMLESELKEPSDCPGAMHIEERRSRRRRKNRKKSIRLSQLIFRFSIIYFHAF